MIALQRVARAVFLAAGASLFLLPILLELAVVPGIQNLFLEQILALELFLALTTFFAGRAGAAAKMSSAAGALLLSAISASLGFWVARFLGTEAAFFLEPGPALLCAAFVALALVFLATSSLSGRPLVVLVGTAVLAGYLGQSMPGGSLFPPVPLTSYTTYLVYGSEGLLGRALDIIVTFVLVYLVFGQAFVAAGGGETISNLALRVAGGGPANAIRACVLASGLFGMVSGAATSNVLTSGTFSLPSMRRVGLSREKAAGVEAAASTGGQIMPPVMGATAFLLADFLNLTYSAVALAALLPALGCYLAFFRQADLMVPEGRANLERTALPPIGMAGFLHVIPPAVLVGVLIFSDRPPTTAALAGALACVLISPALFDVKTCLRRYRAALDLLIPGAVQLICTAAVIGLLMGVFQSTGLAVAGTLAIDYLGQESALVAVLLTGIATFILGLGVASVGVYVVAAGTLAPGLIALGVEPLVAHFFILYCGTLSMITPPVAFASLAASTLAGSDFGRTSREALRFGWILFVMPFVIVLRPGLLLLGGWADILAAAASTSVFILAVTCRGFPIISKAALVIAAFAAVSWQGSAAVSVSLSALLAIAIWTRARRLRAGQPQRKR